MKLDKIKFARLIQHLSQYGLDDLETIDNFIDIEIPITKVSCDNVNELLKQINNPDSFIDAIKAYRDLTGAELKECKDAIERYCTIPKASYSLIDKTNVPDGE
jgi:hypothetical protein